MKAPSKLTATGRCRICGKLQVRLATNGMGLVVELPDPCACVVPVKPKPTREWAKHVDRERRRACICQLCDLPVVGKPKVALYCETHRAERIAEAQRKMRAKVGNKHQRTYYERHGDRKRKSARDRYQKNAAERERRNEYKRQWRKLNRNKVRAQKERAALRNWKTAEVTAAEKTRRYRAEVVAGLRQPKRARRNKEGERLCVTPYCRSVMHGRAKKCDRCKTKEAKQAIQLLPEIIKRAA